MATIVDQGIKCYRGAAYSVFKGDSMLIEVPVVDGDDAAIDTAAFGFELQIFSGAVKLFGYNEVSPEVTMGNGKITIAITAEDTATITTNTTLTFAARLYAANDVIVTLSEGTFSVKDNSVTRTAIIDIIALTGLPTALEVGVGELVQLAVNFVPTTTTDKRLVWASSDDDVVVVSSTGLVTGIAPGTADVTATSVADDEVFDTCAITVPAE